MMDQSRPRRRPTRFLAPLALAAMVVVTYLVIQHAEHTGSGGSRTGTNTSARQHSQTHKGHTTTKKGTPTYYVVKSGDSLSIISARTGVPLPTLELLNPGVSSNSLQVGQRLRLRR